MSRARRSSFTVYLPLLQTRFSWNRRKSVYFLTNKHIQKGCVVPHSQSRIHPKNFSVEHQLFPEAGFVHIIFKTTLLSETVPVCRVWGSPAAPSHRAQSLGPCSSCTSSASARALICRSNQVLLPGLTQLGLPCSSPLKEGFSCRRKASLTGFLLINPSVRSSVILVSIWPRSLCLHLPPPSPWRWRPVTLCCKRGADLSVQWISLTRGCPREE